MKRIFFIILCILATWLYLLHWFVTLWYRNFLVSVAWGHIGLFEKRSDASITILVILSYLSLVLYFYLRRIRLSNKIKISLRVTTLLISIYTFYLSGQYVKANYTTHTLEEKIYGITIRNFHYDSTKISWRKYSPYHTPPYYDAYLNMADQTPEFFKQFKMEQIWFVKSYEVSGEKFYVPDGLFGCLCLSSDKEIYLRLDQRPRTSSFEWYWF